MHLANSYPNLKTNSKLWSVYFLYILYALHCVDEPLATWEDRLRGQQYDPILNCDIYLDLLHNDINVCGRTLEIVLATMANGLEFPIKAGDSLRVALYLKVVQGRVALYLKFVQGSRRERSSFCQETCKECTVKLH